MDPDANLREQRVLAQRIGDAEARGVPAPSGYAERLAELALALDDWMKHGGFPPKDWQQANRPTGGTPYEGSGSL